LDFIECYSESYKNSNYGVSAFDSSIFFSSVILSIVSKAIASLSPTELGLPTTNVNLVGLSKN